MKRKFVTLILLFALPFSACIKYVVPIPPPPGGSSTSTSSPTGNTPYGVSMYVDGRYSTYNTNLSVDTTQNQFNFMSWGDSAWCHNLQLGFGINKSDNSPLTAGMYVPASLNENQCGFTIAVFGGWSFANNVGFVAFPDTVNITNLTDTTITGTFWGVCTGQILSQDPGNNGPLYYDSVMTVTNGKFYLRRN